MKKQVCILIVLCLASVFMEAAETYTLRSPGKKNRITLTKGEDGLFRYQVDTDKKTILLPSALGLKTNRETLLPAAGWTVADVDYLRVDTVWTPVWGKRQVVPEVYNQMTVYLQAAEALRPTMQIVFRAYDDGVAFRYILPQGEGTGVIIDSETTEFRFAGDYTAWYYNGENHNVGPEQLTESDGLRRPVMTIQADDTHYAALHEADLASGDPLLLQSKRGSTHFTVASHHQVSAAGYVSAWRTLLLGDAPGKLVDSHLLELLNPLPQGDFSWVKPGVALWDWRMNGAIVDGFTHTMSYPTWERAVDFASQQGFSYLVLDANWYGPEFEADSDPLKGGKAESVQKLIRYGKSKNVGIWLYLNDVGGKKYPVEETLKQYADWGAAGVKYGFMNGSMMEKNHWTRKVTALCAQNHLLVDYHDNPVHPYGQMRTWPNAVTREYCQAQLDAHKIFEPKTFVTSVFVNMVAGPLDMNNGMFDLRQGRTTRTDCNLEVPSTLASEAARTLVTFSGATIIPDIPEYYQKYPALLRFLSAQQMPWKESRTLAGEIGKYIVMMRQAQPSYLVGAVTNEEAREVTIPLSFLPKGKFEVEVTQDGAGAHYLTNRETVQTTRRIVTRKDKINVSLAAGGGSCLLIKPINEEHEKDY